MSTGKEQGQSVRQRFEAVKRTKLYDLIAATPLIIWYCYSGAQQLSPIGQQIALAKLIAQTDLSALSVIFVARLAANIAVLLFIMVLIVLLAVRRTPQGKAKGLYPRFVAVAGTAVGVGIVQLPPQELSITVYLISLLLILAGTLFAIYAVLSLGRSLSILPEARGLVTQGPYALIRHPLYVGEVAALVGLTLQYLSLWALLLLVLQCIFQLERIRNEEQVLSRTFPEYRDYMARTGRLVPHLRASG